MPIIDSQVHAHAANTPDRPWQPVPNWTRAFAVVNYAQAVEPFRLTGRLTESEPAVPMGGACADAYGWAPAGC